MGPFKFDGARRVNPGPAKPVAVRSKKRQFRGKTPLHNPGMASMAQMLEIAHLIRRDLGTRRPLRSLAARARLSSFHLQREFTRLMGESPARYAQRLRLLLVQAELLGGNAPLRMIARQAGFASTEALIRSFRRLHGCSPLQYRRRHRPARRDAGFLRGLRLAGRVAPCARLHHVHSNLPARNAMPMLSTTVRTLPAQPALIIRSRIPRSAIAATIGESLGRIVPHALGSGATLAGQPFARYPEFGIGMITIEVGMPLASAVDGKGEIESFQLPAGRAAVAVHGGSYEQLPDTYAALEQWMAGQGLAAASAPWEVYVTDPADHADPADWRTEIFQPLR
jgi:AraC family transcriptional regulator